MIIIERGKEGTGEVKVTRYETVCNSSERVFRGDGNVIDLLDGYCVNLKEEKRRSHV